MPHGADASADDHGCGSGDVQATLNARLFDVERQALLLGPEQDLLDAVIEGAGQKEAAELMGVSQSTVSRRLKSIPQPESLEGAALKQ